MAVATKKRCCWSLVSRLLCSGASTRPAAAATWTCQAAAVDCAGDRLASYDRPVPPSWYAVFGTEAGTDVEDERRWYAPSRMSRDGSKLTPPCPLPP